MKYRYREPHEMKDSKVEWLGMIPKEWNNGKFKYSITYQKGKNPKVISEEKGEGYFPYLSTGFLRTGACDTYTKIDSSLCFVKENELLLLWDGANAGEIFDSKEGIVSSTMAKLSFFDFTNKNFGKHLLKYLERPLRFSTIGMGIPHVNSEVLKNLPWNTPKVKEQQKIAKFLDRKTTEFDLVIEKKEKLIEKLEEAKKSLISEVVTGKKQVIARQVISNKSHVIGDDGQEQEVTRYEVRNRAPHEMKDSGVEWLGMIPQEWGISKIKYSTYVKGRIGWQGLKSNEFIDEGPHLVTGTDFIKNKINWKTCYRISNERFEEAPTIHLKNGDLLITKDGTIGKIAIVKECPKKAVLNSGVFITRCINQEYITEYMFFILDSEIFTIYIDINKTGSTILHLYQETFVNFSYPLPNRDVQKKIIKYLNEKTAEFDSIIQKNKDQIKKIKEAKQSLISEAVTGKIEVID